LEPQQTPGFSRILAPADTVGKTLIVLMLLISVVIGYPIITRKIVVLTARHHPRHVANRLDVAGSMVRDTGQHRLLH
jgi:hypothetical protein